jgi:hypothetical protein
LLSGGYTKKLVNINERSFLVQILNYENGNFISVTEGLENIGGMIVSINSGPVPSTSTIIPPKSEAVFLKLVSERIAYTRQGMCLVTGNFEKALDKQITKQLMDIILEESKQ